MTKTSMWHPTGRGRGVRVTAKSTGSGALGALVTLVVVIVAAVALYRAATSPAVIEAAATVSAFLDTFFTIVFSIAGLVALVGGVYLFDQSVTWRPSERRAVAEFYAKKAAAVQARAERAAAEKIAEEQRAEAAAQAAAALDDEPAHEPGQGLDGTRDGRLIDAADRFRSLGTFLPTDDDQEPVDSTSVDHDLDREA